MFLKYGVVPAGWKNMWPFIGANPKGHSKTIEVHFCVKKEPIKLTEKEE